MRRAPFQDVLPHGEAGLLRPVIDIKARGLLELRGPHALDGLEIVQPARALVTVVHHELPAQLRVLGPVITQVDVTMVHGEYFDLAVAWDMQNRARRARPEPLRKASERIS